MKIMRLLVAIMLDVFGAICGALSAMGLAGIPALVFLAEILSFIPDMLGFVFLNPAMGLSGSKKLKGITSEKAKKRFIITFILELLPFGFLPVWTINELTAK
ncbi:hypothetical protein KKC63_02005 [Patescibacteria group bacterium]|nr:hypothetical protein [Patescibacteria group bacterium]MBU4023397.1 hypothetical protein [Patescibacteria group bacterium]